MTDVLYLGIGLGFFLLTWGLLSACEQLGEQRGGKS